MTIQEQSRTWPEEHLILTKTFHAITDNMGRLFKTCEEAKEAINSFNVEVLGLRSELIEKNKTIKQLEELCSIKSTKLNNLTSKTKGGKSGVKTGKHKRGQ